MALSAELRAWLLDRNDPSVRYRVLRELLDRPEDDPEVSAARREIGVRGWAAEILARQHPRLDTAHGSAILDDVILGGQATCATSGGRPHVQPQRVEDVSQRLLLERMER